MQLVTLTFIASLLAAPVPTPKVSKGAVAAGVLGATAVGLGIAAYRNPALVPSFLKLGGKSATAATAEMEANALKTAALNVEGKGLTATGAVLEEASAGPAARQLDAANGVFKSKYFPSWRESYTYLNAKYANWVASRAAAAAAKANPNPVNPSLTPSLLQKRAFTFELNNKLI
jgi:hypothetical protein